MALHRPFIYISRYVWWELTVWGLKQMTDIFQTISYSAIWWTRFIVFIPIALFFPFSHCVKEPNKRQAITPSRWRHYGCDTVSNHQPHDCLLNRIFRRRSKKTPMLRVTGLCVGNSPGTGEYPTQMVRNVKYVSIWWRHHANPWRSGPLKWILVTNVSLR